MKLPVVSGKDTVKALLDEGFVLVSQKGSHIKLRKFHKPVGKTTVIVPNHKVLKKGTLAGFLSLSSIFNDVLPERGGSGFPALARLPTLSRSDCGQGSGRLFLSASSRGYSRIRNKAWIQEREVV